MFAVVETGGKQYRVAEGDTLYVEKLDVAVGEEVALEKVLMISAEDDSKVGRPYIEGAKVLAKVDKHGKGKKVIVFKFKPKRNYRRKSGHRQPYTKLVIEKIEV